MKLALIAGNRNLPLLFSRCAKEKADVDIVGICFKGETDPRIVRLIDKVYWIEVGKLDELIDILKKEDIKDCVMVGQINPRRIFNRKKWDPLILNLIKESDFRPHSIFSKIISYLEEEGFRFLDSTLYMNKYLAHGGVMNRTILDQNDLRDIDLGLNVISKYVELDVGQTIVVKNGAVLALEAMEGTDRAIRRAYKIGGRQCVVLKFSKKHQDLRFDVPVVGLFTLALLKKIKAKALILEEKRVIILEKKLFLGLAEKWGIAILGAQRK